MIRLAVNEAVDKNKHCTVKAPPHAVCTGCERFSFQVRTRAPLVCVCGAALKWIMCYIESDCQENNTEGQMTARV